VTIDGGTCPREKLLSVLGGRLDVLPAEVRETRRFVLGRMRGLTFGVIKHRLSTTEVFLEGQGERRAQLSRESQGPRACWNALERLFGSYEATCEELRRELALSETKLRDFEDRLGAVFPHERYIAELSALRDELKAALSASQPEGAPPKGRTAGEVSGLITALRETHVIETVPVRRPGAAARSERPATARVRKEAEVVPVEVLAPEAIEKQDGERGPAPAEERPATASVAAKAAAYAPREVHRRRYQKWLF